MKNIVVLTGAGISAESGIKTFRDVGGLWEGHDIMEVASPQGWNKNQKLVLDFYNKRRKQLLAVKPNAAHQALVTLEKYFNIQIITQNVDDLHERAGSSNVLHLHGELLKVRSCKNANLIYPWKKDLAIGDVCEENAQLRPHIVWFGEDVPLLQNAIEIVKATDILIIIGTSMQVYPAASLIHFAKSSIPIYFVNPNESFNSTKELNLININEKATLGVQKLVNQLIE